ncbi:hypothetical protein NC653_014647 [Populus alba x Populus x berolinensis]|uniref:Pentatricopeptide repeat-containing protein n=1 Tax=Populus alba x Populus x berolinensis TaxID=444605 RepID=A0AAD6W459_9ROSI|nr:hypothetical protein NC653_014647 [Populus alba x Populus x berolinensis]
MSYQAEADQLGWAEIDKVLYKCLGWVDTKEKHLQSPEFCFKIRVLPVWRASDGLLVFGRGFRPNAVTFSSMIKGLCVDDKIGEAAGLFKKMAWLIGEAKKLFPQMKEGRGICPDVAVYSSLMHYLCSMDEREDKDMLCKPMKMEEVRELFELMVQRGKLATAWDLFYRMPNKGLKPAFVTYAIMIHGTLYRRPKGKGQGPVSGVGGQKLYSKCGQVTFNTLMLVSSKVMRHER